jgi:hypothetical protein
MRCHRRSRSRRSQPLQPKRPQSRSRGEKSYLLVGRQLGVISRRKTDFLFQGQLYKIQRPQSQSHSGEKITSGRQLGVISRRKPIFLFQGGHW